MPCDGIFEFNPMCLPIVGARVGQTAAAAVTDSAFGSIAGFFSAAANNATTWLWEQINEATTLDLHSPKLIEEMTVTAGIAAVLCLGLFLIQVITGAVRGHPVMLGRAFSGLIIALVGSAFALATTRLLLAAVDELSNGVLQFTLGTNIDGLGAKFTFLQMSGMNNPAVVILVSLAVLASVVVIWAAMMIRKLMILLAAVLAPIAFAGATADITRGWVRKWIEFTAAMIASKLLLVIILSLGVSVLNGAGQSGSGATQSATQLAGGSLILLLGGLAPWVAIRMFHFAGDSLYAAHSVARESAAGAQSIIHGPQKVAALQGTARSLSGGFGSRGGGYGGGWGGGRAGGTPPAPPRPIADASASGAAGGTGAANGQAGMAASTGGAAAATSAAVPVAGALVAVGTGVKGAVNTAAAHVQSATTAGQPAQPTHPGSTVGPGPAGQQAPPKQPPMTNGGS